MPTDEGSLVVSIAMITFTTLADIYNDLLETSGSDYRVVSDIVEAVVYLGDDAVSVPFRFTLLHTIVSS